LRVISKDTGKLAIGQRVTCGIRPEYVHITGKKGENTILGSVTKVVEGVTMIDCYFRVNDGVTGKHNFEASLLKSEAPPILDGQLHYFYMSPQRLAIITR
jgi:hypothetical protein